jgi:hypothetical protein
VNRKAAPAGFSRRGEAVRRQRAGRDAVCYDGSDWNRAAAAPGKQ